MPRASLAKSPHLPDSQTPLTHPLTAALPGPPKFWPPAKVPICHHVYWYSPGWHIASHHRHSLTLQCPLIPHCEILPITLCHFSTSYSLSHHFVHLPSDHLQRPARTPLLYMLCLGKRWINPNCLLFPNRLCIHNKSPFLHPQIPHTVNDPTFDHRAC